MSSILIELAGVVIIAAVLGIIARIFKQPVILAYLVTGILIGSLGILQIGDKDSFTLFADLGIMFLLFLVGLEMNYASLRFVGATSVIIGLGQLIVTFALGFLIATLLHFPFLHAIYIAIALTFSSTIIVVKLLSDKKELHSLYGKISIGYLLVQDFVAIMLLVALSGMEAGQAFQWSVMAIAIIKAVALFLIMLGLGMTVLPRLLKRISRSLELLFVCSLAWLFLVAAVVNQFGFSIEIGGFLAGLALANSSESFQIANRIKPLRDFFILIFFVILGSSITLTGNIQLLAFTILFSLFVLIINPLVVIIIMGLLGYPKRTSFFAGINTAQVSEFSLILVAVGLRLGHIDDQVVALVTTVTVVTIIFSTYYIVYAERIFRWLSDLLTVFEHRSIKKSPILADQKLKKPIILIGFHRTGQSIATNLPKHKMLVVEFNPDIVQYLKRENFDHLFGDISDPDIFNEIDFEHTEVVVSTIPSLDDTIRLLDALDAIKADNPKVTFKIIVRAEDEREAKIFYKRGADYVLLPQFTSGQYLGRVMALDPGLRHIHNLKKRDMQAIKDYRLSFM